MVLLKLIYLATLRIAEKWTMPLQGWAVSTSQLKIKFDSSTTADCYSVRQPCGKPFVACRLLLTVNFFTIFHNEVQLRHMQKF